MEKSNADSVRLWLRGCPVIDPAKRFGVDYLSDTPTEYSIQTIPSPLKTRENILGEEIPLAEQEQSFFFIARLPYGQDIAQNNANMKFCENVCKWILERNAEKDFPDWDGGRIRSVIPTLSGGLNRVTANEAEYQIQIKLNYRRS